MRDLQSSMDDGWLQTWSAYEAIMAAVVELAPRICTDYVPGEIPAWMSIDNRLGCLRSRTTSDASGQK
jgi:hypothetical protein